MSARIKFDDFAYERTRCQTHGQRLNLARVAFFLTLYILCSAELLYCQTNFNNQWISGAGRPYRMDFSFTPVDITYLDTTKTIYCTAGNASICDSSGKAILFSDGYNIYDSLSNYLDGGDTLVSTAMYIQEDGWSGFSQSSIFLPLENKIYYLITPNATDSVYNNWYTTPYVYTAGFDELLFHKIDMSANGGSGQVIVRGGKIMEHEKMLRTMMMACKHANGKDWWLLKQMYEDSGNFDGVYPLSKNKIAKILVTKDSIYSPSFQYFPSPDFGFFEQSGQAMFSQDGTKYASTCRGMNKVFIANFDRCTGELNNPLSVNVPNYSQHNPTDTTWQDLLTQGLCFSPNGQYLYVIKYFNILQLDLFDSDSNTAWHWVAGLDTTWQAFQRYSSTYLGPDGKIYIGNLNGLSKQMSLIENPNAKGTACNWCPRCLHFPWYGAATAPCMPNYDLGELQPCWPLANSEFSILNFELEVYPNPASTIFYIKTKSEENRELYTAIGELVFVTKGDEIDVSRYSSGIYYIKVSNAVRKVVIE